VLVCFFFCAFAFVSSFFLVLFSFFKLCWYFLFTDSIDYLFSPLLHGDARSGVVDVSLGAGLVSCVLFSCDGSTLPSAILLSSVYSFLAAAVWRVAAPQAWCTVYFFWCGIAGCVALFLYFFFIVFFTSCSCLLVSVFLVLNYFGWLVPCFFSSIFFSVGLSCLWL